MASLMTVLTVMILASCKKDKIAIGNVDCATITYANTIAPLFASNCNTSGCHNSGSNNGDLTTYSKLKPYVNNGTIKKEVLTNQTMPTSGPLSSEQLAQVQCWLDAGALDN